MVQAAFLKIPLVSCLWFVIGLKSTEKKKKKQGFPYFFSILRFSFSLLAVFLIGYAQFLASLGATACQYAATIGCGHSLTETVLVVAATVVWLKCSLHVLFLFYLFSHNMFRGAKIRTFLNITKPLYFFFLDYRQICLPLHAVNQFYIIK